jgi:hypothetical protein
MRSLLFILLSLARAQASIAMCDAYRRTNGRQFGRDFHGPRQDRRKLPRERRLLPRNCTILMARRLNVQDTTGLTGAQFNELVERTASRIALPRRCFARNGKRATAATLLVEDRIYMVLVYLRGNQRYRQMEVTFQVSPSFISRDLRHILPIISAELHNEIRWPADVPPGDEAIKYAQGLIDCTAHWRREIGGDGSYFRRDIAMPSIGAQVITSLNCEIWDVVFFAGHNNDQGIYRATHMDELLHCHGIRLLSDLGYTGRQLYRPDSDDGDDPYFEAKHRAVRAAIERLFSFNAAWAVAGEISRLPLHMHVLALDAIWRLTAWNMRLAPMAPALPSVVIDE